MPKILVSITIVLIALAFIPPAMIAASRSNPSPNRPIHMVHDMDRQARPSTQQPSEIFVDGRASRPPVDGTIAREDVIGDDHRMFGRVDGAWAEALPDGIELNMDLLEHGRERFNIYCGLCHGRSGYGDGIINRRAAQLALTGENQSTWVPALSLHDETVIEQPVGQIFHTASYGIRNMAGYAAQISVEDRWAIASYVKALQRSQRASMNDVPQAMRDALVPVELPNPAAAAAADADGAETEGAEQ